MQQSRSSKRKILPPMQPERFLETHSNSEILLKAKDEEERLQDVLFENLVEEQIDFSRIETATTKFVNCKFYECSFERAEWKDVVFQSCDLSGCDFSNGYFERVEFQSCKGVGTKFADSIFKQVSIVDCYLDYSNFDHSKFENMKVEQTQLKSANLAQCKCKNIYWNSVELTNTSFFHTPLRGIDLRRCQIAGLVLSDQNEELKGVVVDIYQAAELSKRLGLVIKGDEQ